MNETVNMIDKAAGQSDRWLLIAVLVLMIFGVLMIWRWIIADRDKMSTRLTQVTDRHIDAMEKFSEVVATNTSVVETNSLVMQQVKETISRCNNLR